MMLKQIRSLLPLLSLLVSATAFMAPHVVDRSSNTALQSVIRSADDDFGLDPSSGGVGLAQESVIKVTGDVKHKPGSANPKPAELLRYTKLQEVQESQVSSSVHSIVCTGRGTELYKDPGSSTAKEVVYAPLDAVRDAMNAAGSTQEADKLVINFLGGDDLMIMEVLNAVEQLVLNLDVKTSTKISFNSLCHNSFPMQQAYLTVVALGKGGSGDDEEAPKLKGVDKALADGEVYFQDGKYFTVAKEDINAAVA